jgi:UDP-N-acetylmuramoyl-tripeptide--D-alanyl-D-alanine ligase
MIPVSVGELAAIVGGAVEGDVAVTVTAPAVLDGGQAEPGGLFVAFAGEHVDGHDYAGQSGEAGAVAVLGSRPTALPTVVVEDAEAAEAALQALAADVVARLRDWLSVVGLTGSQGKTSTKDLLAAVLSRAAPTIAAIGSLNSELGVPLTMLRADAATRFLVLEMGARHVGDIGELSGLVAPTSLSSSVSARPTSAGSARARPSPRPTVSWCRVWRPAAPPSSTPTTRGWSRCARSPMARC